MYCEYVPLFTYALPVAWQALSEVKAWPEYTHGGMGGAGSNITPGAAGVPGEATASAAGAPGAAVAAIAGELAKADVAAKPRTVANSVANSAIKRLVRFTIAPPV